MKSGMRSMLMAATVAAAVPLLALAQEKGKAAPDEMTGVKVGEMAPKFTLKDQDGRERSLDDLLKTGNVALVFTRSADW